MTKPIAVIWADIASWLAVHASGRAAELLPGADDAAIASLEDGIGASLAPDHAASLRVHNGMATLTSYQYLDSEAVLAKWQSRAPLAKDERHPHDPSGAQFRNVWWHHGWVPFAEDSGGNLLCIDLDPGPEGKAGQVLVWEMAMGPGLAGADSLGTWLEDYCAGLKAGRFAVDEEGYLSER